MKFKPLIMSDQYIRRRKISVTRVTAHCFSFRRIQKVINLVETFLFQSQ